MTSGPLVKPRPDEPASAASPRIAYLTGTYPAVSHTFISREVSALRRLGVDVQTFSVRRAPADQLLTEEDRRSAEDTPSIQPPDPRAVLGAHLRAVTRAPWRYGQTLLLALRLSPGGVRAMTWQFFYFAEAILLWQWLRRRGITHVHVHFANAASSIAMLYAHFAQREGATWSLTMHGPAEFDHVGFFRLAEKVRRARFVVCISDYARSQLMKLTPPDQWRKLIVVHCGVDPTVFSPGPRRHQESGDRLTVLCVGRLAPDKGYGILLDALASLPADDARRVQVVIVGDGPQREELQRRAAELPGCHVTFAGAVGQDRLLPLYADADIFCLPSLAEGLPVVLMEAMAMGLPVIAPRIMGIPELVSDRATGLTVSPGRADLLASALRELLDDEGLRRSLGAAGRERVLADYDVRRSAALLHDLYSDLVAGRGAGLAPAQTAR